MGISKTAIKCFFIAKKHGVSFESITTLGRQHFLSNNQEVQRIAALYDLSIKRFNLTDQFSEPFLEALGAEVIDSIDFSNYEKATILHDMNMPIPNRLLGKYDCVFDGGTLEHVFNFPQAIKNCMQLLKPGGHFLSVNPSNNQLGHGFYQFSPELYYRVFSRENGFEIVKIFVCADQTNSIFFEVSDPDKVQSRVTLKNCNETDLIVIAKRTELKEIFATTPQQSDYAATWEVVSERALEAPKGIKKLYQKITPLTLRDKIWKLRYHIKNRKTYSSELGSFNPKHFKKEF